MCREYVLTVKVFGNSLSSQQPLRPFMDKFEVKLPDRDRDMSHELLRGIIPHVPFNKNSPDFPFTKIGKSAAATHTKGSNPYTVNIF